MSIRLTEPAAERVRQFLAQKGGVGLRVGVRRTGCSGWAYTVDLAREVGEDDIVFDEDGLPIVVDAEALKYVDGSEIDFVTEGLNRTFKFRNPNVTDECGCGESFTID